ncbi:MAG: ribonuclease domain-containing protein [Elusimicrobiota bacterium]|jgi:guanyl-specific ribonuclease Sa
MRRPAVAAFAWLFLSFLTVPLALSGERRTDPENRQYPVVQAQALVAVRAHPLLGVRRIEPGTGLSPVFSDPSRVETILKLIADVYYGRPLQYPKDGVVFANREGRLPAQAADYYHEYTVMPPKGSPRTFKVGDREFTVPPPTGNRGVERVIIGGGELAYYTPDHYKTFIPLTILR